MTDETKIKDLTNDEIKEILAARGLPVETERELLFTIVVSANELAQQRAENTRLRNELRDYRAMEVFTGIDPTREAQVRYVVTTLASTVGAKGLYDMLDKLMDESHEAQKLAKKVNG